MRIILASESPRRQELMHFLFDDFLVIPSFFPERDVLFQEDPGPYCEELAYRKALSVATDHPNDLVIGSDTIVWASGQILNKPRDKEDARRMIGILQGRDHEVKTAYSLLHLQQDIRITGHVSTRVTFAPMDETEIRCYLEKNDYAGKAGAYAIQGAAARYIRGIEGDFYTVVGLPVAMLYKELHELGMIEQ